MLEVTQAAVDELKRLRDEEGDVPQEAGVRIQLVAGEESAQERLGLAFVEGPEDNDLTVSDESGLTVFLSSNLAVPLGSAILDAKVTEGGMELELRDQNPLAHAGHAHDDHHHHDHPEHEGHEHSDHES